MVFAGDPFYFSLIRKYVAVFGACFNNIVIERNLPDANTDSQVIKVPLEYAPKEKMMARINSDPDLDRPYSALLPRMSFEMTTMTYRPDRKIQSIGRKVIKHPTDKNKFRVQYNPVPYDLMFSLYVYVKNAEDATKIVEQILPFFAPDWTVSMELIPDMNDTRDVPILINGDPTIQDLYDGDFKQRRVLIWTINFTMKAFLFGPIRNKPMIKFVTLNIRPAYAEANTDNESANDDVRLFSTSNTISPVVEQITLQPGLLANGSPTTNASLSVDYHIIAVDDDWGFAETTKKV